MNIYEVDFGPTGGVPAEVIVVAPSMEGAINYLENVRKGWEVQYIRLSPQFVDVYIATETP